MARRAGVEPGTLYRHFPHRDALLAAVIGDTIDALHTHAREVLATDGRRAVTGRRRHHHPSAAVGVRRAEDDDRAGGRRGAITGQLRAAASCLRPACVQQPAVRSSTRSRRPRRARSVPVPGTAVYTMTR
ncbi:TetR family transcriptional regulator [Streptomyces sp. MspMP-M5]|uniref:TetR family transcriptional regulator n=1 Tax=Streptomyces sp. MspMP-M5 TaxID=1155718 RepID=UPI003B63A381